MYEDYYGLVEKPFSLTPDPRYLYKSESHAHAFELLQYGIHRREGFVVVTGDIGTGKTTLCRAVLDQLDRKVFTALGGEDLLTSVTCHVPPATCHVPGATCHVPRATCNVLKNGRRATAPEIS